MFWPLLSPHQRLRTPAVSIPLDDATRGHAADTWKISIGKSGSSCGGTAGPRFIGSMSCLV
jgi:hypothetical protein